MADENTFALTPEKLDSFVDAAIGVQEVTQEWGPKVQGADDEAEQKALAEEAGVAMRAAVEETDGITIAEYVAIGEAAEQDPQLAQHIATVAQAKAGTPGEG